MMMQVPKNKIYTRTQGAPVVMEPGYTNYTGATIMERVNILRNQCRVVDGPQENYFKTVGEKHAIFKKHCQEDVELRGWRYDMLSPEDGAICTRLIAQKAWEVLHQTNTKAQRHRILKSTDEKALMPLLPGCDLRKYASIYRTPDFRFQIASNITYNPLNPIPVYCDISKNIQEVRKSIKETLAFHYIDSNILDPKVEKDLAKAVEMANNLGNHIKCTCHAKGLRCDEVEECPCYQMNEKMKLLRYEKKDAEPTKFKSLEPTLFNCNHQIFYGHCGFACSLLCDCEGKCSNNAMFLIEKNLFPLEIFRSDMSVGFGVCCSVFIPAGTAIMEFTGELLEARNIEEDNAYAYQVSYTDDDKWSLFLNDAPFEKNYIQLLKCLHKRNFLIDPTRYGNIGRMVGHACSPNLEIVRIFKESLSPAHISLVMVTLEDIYPNTLLSIDYGPGYKLEQCKCNTFACRSGELNEQLKTFNTFSLAKIVKKIQEIRRHNFQRTIIDPLERIAQSTDAANE